MLKAEPTPEAGKACLGTTTGLRRVKSEGQKAVLTPFLQIINKYNCLTTAAEVLGRSTRRRPPSGRRRKAKLRPVCAVLECSSPYLAELQSG
jgi:hypothetical protein